MICFSAPQILKLQKESLKTIINKTDFRDLFESIKQDIFTTYQSTDRADLDQRLNELINIFNDQFNSKYARERSKNSSLTEEDVYPFGTAGRIRGKDITDYLDSLEPEIIKDPEEVKNKKPSRRTRKRGAPSEELNNPTREHLNNNKKTDDPNSKFYITKDDILYPAKVNNMIALVKEVPTAKGKSFIVAAYLTNNEVKKFGLSEMLDQSGINVSKNNIVFSEFDLNVGELPGVPFFKVSPSDINVNYSNPFVVDKSNRNEIKYSTVPTIGTPQGTTLKDFVKSKDLITREFNKMFKDLQVVSTFLQIPIGRGDEGFSMMSVGRPIIRVVAKKADGTLVNKTLGVEFKPRPISKNDSIYKLAQRFYNAVEELGKLGVDQNNILRISNELAKQYTFDKKTGKITKPDSYTNLESILGFESAMIPHLEEIISTYYGPVDGLLKLNSLRDFYNEYKKKVTKKETDALANMFTKLLGITLSNKAVNDILDSDDLRSGNILLNVLKPELGHKINNVDKNKYPDPNLIITGRDGKTATYGQLLEAYRKVRNQISIIDRGENNEKFMFQYEGQKKKVDLYKNNQLITIFPNRNTVARIPGNSQNALIPDMDEDGNIILQTKPKLRVGGGQLPKELARLVDTTGEELVNSRVIPELEDLFTIDDSNGVRINPLLINQSNYLKTLLNKQGAILRKFVNDNVTFFKANLGQDWFVTTKKGQLKLRKQFDLSDEEIQNSIIEILSINGALKDSAGNPTVGQQFIDTIIEDNEKIEELLDKEPPTMSVLSKILDDSNYDSTGHWKMLSQKEGTSYSNFYLRRNLSIADTSTEFTVDEYGRMTYKEGMNGFGLLSYAYSYITDPSFKNMYEEFGTNPILASTFQLPSKAEIEAYILRNGERKIKKSFEDSLLNQIFSTFAGTEEGKLSVIKGEPETRATSAITPVVEEEVVAPTSEEAEASNIVNNIIKANEEAEDNDDDGLSYSDPIDNDILIEQSKAREYFRKQFPFGNDRVLNFLTREAFNEKYRSDKIGVFDKNGLINIATSPDGQLGYKVLRHEIFHRIFNEYLTPQERQELFDAFKQKYFSDRTFVDINEFEEAMAIKYQDYEREGNEVGVIQRFFNLILRLFNFIRVNTNSIEEFFDQVEDGKFAVKKSAFSGSNRYMTDPLNKMGGMDNYDRAIKSIKRNFYRLMVTGKTLGNLPGVKFNSSVEVRNYIANDLQKKITKLEETLKNPDLTSEENATLTDDLTFLKNYVKNLDDLIQNAFSFVDLDTKTEIDEANLGDEIADKENQNELANSPERVRFWLSNIGKPTEEGKESRGADFIKMENAFAKLVELTSKIDFNGKTSVEEQLKIAVSTFTADRDFALIKEALVKLTKDAQPAAVKNENVFFINSNTAFITSADAEFNGYNSLLFDINQLEEVIGAEGAKTYIYREGDLEIAGSIVTKDNKTLQEYLKEVFKIAAASGIEITENSAEELYQDVAKSYNNAVSAEILKDIIKVISSNRERNPITLEQSTFQSFGVNNVRFQQNSKHNKEYSENVTLKGKLAEAMLDDKRLNLFYSGGVYTFKKTRDPNLTEEQLEALIEAEEAAGVGSTTVSVSPEHLKLLKKVGSKDATQIKNEVKKNYKELLTAVKKVGAYFRLGLDIDDRSNLNETELADIVGLLYDVFGLKDWTGKNNPLAEKLNAEIEVRTGVRTTRGDEEELGIDDQEQDDEIEAVGDDNVTTTIEPLGPFRYLDEFNFFPLAKANLKKESRDVSLSERAPNGKDTIHRYIRKSHIFDIVNRLIFNNPQSGQTNPINLNQLNSAYDFLSGKYYGYNPFVNGSSKILESVFQIGDKNIAWNGKEYFKKHSNQSIGELVSKDLLYFAYYHKVAKGGLIYAQPLPQQGDSTAHNALVVNINNADAIQGKILSVLDQFQNRPTIEELTADLGWTPAGYERDHLVDFNMLSVAIANAKIKGVNVTPFKDGYKINRGTVDLTTPAAISAIYKEYNALLQSDVKKQLNLLVSNDRFRLPGDFFRRLSGNNALVSVIRSFIDPTKIKSFDNSLTKLLNTDKLLTKSGQETRYKREKGSAQRNDLYQSEEFKEVMSAIMIAHNFNHGVNAYFLDQVTKGASEFFKSSAGALKRRDSAGSPKESLSVRTIDSNGNVVKGTERFARPKFKALIVNDVTIVSDLSGKFKDQVAAFKNANNLSSTEEEIEQFARELLSLDSTKATALIEKFLGKTDITDTEKNNVLDLAFTYINKTLSSREFLRQIQGLTDEDLKELDEEYAGEYQPTDGQGFHTTLRNSEIKANTGSNAEVGDILKPLHYEQVGKSGTVFMMKYSSVHLSESFVSDKPILKRIKENLENLNIDEVVFGSAIKASIPQGMIPFNTLTKKGLTQEDIAGSVVTLSNNSYGLQLNPVSMGNEISLFTQLLYFPNATISDQGKVNRIYSALSEIYKSRGEVFNSENYRMGMASGKVFTAVVRNSISANSGTVNDKAADLYDDIAKADDAPYSNPALASTVERSFLREAFKKTIKTKFSGRKAVLVSSVAVNNFASKEFLLENEGFEIMKNSLQTKTVNIGGKNILISEALIPRGRWVMDETGKKVWNGIVSEETQNAIDEAIKNNRPLPDFFLTNYSKSDAFAIRIPTTGIHSGIPLKIKGFYDSNSAVNGIIVPPDIVQRHGSDFDVDSLFIISRATFEEDYSFRMKFDEISQSFVDRLGDVKFRDIRKQKAYNRALTRIKQIQIESKQDRRAATQDEVTSMVTLFRNSAFNKKLVESFGDAYKEEIAMAGFFVRNHKDIPNKDYMKFRYVFNESDDLGYISDDSIQYVGNLAARKKEIISLLSEFRSNSNVRALIKEMDNIEDRIVGFRKGTPIGYDAIIGGYKFQDHIDPEDNSKIKSEFLTQLDSMIPFVSNSDRQKLVKIKTQYLQNVMAEEFMEIFESEDNRHMMVTTIFMEKFKNWAKENTTQRVFPDISSVLSSNEQRRIATAGRIGTGVSAIGIKMLSYFKGFPLTETVTLNALRNGQSVSLDRVLVTRDSLKELDALVNLNIDNIKELGLYPLNLNENTIGIYISLRLMGLTFNEANHIMSSKTMETIANSAGYTPAIIEKMAKETNTLTGKTEYVLDLDKLVAANSDYKNIEVGAIMDTIYRASQLNKDVRDLNFIADSIRSERNSKAELKRLKNTVSKLKSNGFNILTSDFLATVPHIESAINVSLNNLKILEQHSINHSPKIDSILNASVNMKRIKLDKDAVRDEELKRKEVIKYFVSGFVDVRNYPSMMINNRVLSGNEAFMELMYKRHLALEYFVNNTPELSGNMFVKSLTPKRTGNNVPLLEFEGKEVSTDPSFFYKMEEEFKRLNMVEESIIFEIYRRDPSTGVITTEEVAVSDISELDNLDLFYDDNDSILNPTYLRTEFKYNPESKVRRSALQQNYFDYEALKSGLDINNKSMTLVFPNEMHVEFHKNYKELMIKFTQESDPTVLDAIVELFDIEFALNNAGSMVQPILKTPAITQVYTVDQKVRGAKGEALTGRSFEMSSYSGYDGRIGFYDLKAEGPAFNIESFNNPIVSKVVMFGGQMYKLIGQTEMEDDSSKSYLYYTKIGRPRNHFVYNFRSEMISNLNFIRLKQNLLNIDEVKNISLTEGKVERLAEIKGIDINEQDENGESIATYLQKESAEAISKATDLLTRLYFKKQLDEYSTPENLESEEFQEQLRMFARALNVNEVIINNPTTTPQALVRIIQDVLSSERSNVARQNQYSLETGVPRIKVTSMDARRIRIGYDFKLELAFKDSTRAFEDANGNKSILAVVSAYNDPLNYDSQIKKISIVKQLGGDVEIQGAKETIKQNKFSAIVEISEASASELENYFRSNTNVVYLIEENTLSEDILNNALNEENFLSKNNPLNNC
jgi:hypothetical protein